MKIATILILCLAIAVQQGRGHSISEIINGAGSFAKGAIQKGANIASEIIHRAEKTAEDAYKAGNEIARGGINIATGIAKKAIGDGTGVMSQLSDRAASFNKAIREKINDVRSKALKSVLNEVQKTLQKVQDRTRGALQATEISGRKVDEAFIEIENERQESIDDWAAKAKSKLSNSSEEAQTKGLYIIENFASVQSEQLMKCSDSIIKQLESLSEKANATANRYHEPMNKLIQQVGKCSQIKANDYRGLAACAAEIRQELAPLLSAPLQLADIEAKIVKAGLTNVKNQMCVRATLNNFRAESKKTDNVIDQLVAEDKKKAAEEPQPASEENAAPAEEEAAPTEEETAPAKQEEAPADGEAAPAEEEAALAEEESAPAEEEAAPAEEETAPAEEEAAPAEDEAAPAEEEAAPAEEETAPAEEETAPAEEETAPAEEEAAPAKE